MQNNLIHWIGPKNNFNIPVHDLIEVDLSFHWIFNIYVREICMHVKKQQLEPDMEQQTGSKLGKEYIKAVYYHPAYLTYIQSTSCEMPGWRKHKLESRLLGKISITSDKQMTPPLWKKAKKNWRASWWKWKRRVKKLTQHSAFKKEDHGILSHHFMANRWGNNGNHDRLDFLRLQNHCKWWLQPWN